MSHETILLTLALVFGFYMAWSIGANDVANAMGTSVGSGALTLKHAVIVAAVLEFSGAFLVGMHVSETVRKGIVNPEIFYSEPYIFVFGMLAALLAAAVWLQLASYNGWPVSTTHSIVGAILGFGVVVGGLKAVYWGKVASIVASWVISPLFSATISFVIFSFIRRSIFYAEEPVKAAKRVTPYLVFSVFFILTLVLVFKGLKNLHLDLSFTNALIVAALVGVIAAILGAILIAKIQVKTPDGLTARKYHPQIEIGIDKTLRHLQQAHSLSKGELKDDITRILGNVEKLSQTVKEDLNKNQDSHEHNVVEKIFVYLQILSACFVAFAHGANDVANAIGPLSAVLSVLKSGTVALKSTVPIWVLGLGGIGIVVGLATWGWRVIETIGKRITELTPSRGFAAEFGAATTIVIASKLGLPISTTHTLVGAVLGVGLARGMGALNLTTIRDIIVSWVVTIPAGALLAIIFFYILKVTLGG